MLFNPTPPHQSNIQSYRQNPYRIICTIISQFYHNIKKNQRTNNNDISANDSNINDIDVMTDTENAGNIQDNYQWQWNDEMHNAENILRNN